MDTRWYVVKYMSDVFKGEPKNVGVIVLSDDAAVARFAGEQDDRFDGRRIRGVVNSVDAYKSWIQYLRYHIDSGTFDEALNSLQRRKLDNYLIESRGALYEVAPEVDITTVVDDLFASLVTIPASTAGISSLEEKVRQLLFERLAVPNDRIEQDVSYEVRLRGELRNLHFDYRYINGHTTLLDKVSLRGQPRGVEKSVNDLLFRIEHVSNTVNNFITFYESPVDGAVDNVDSQLRTIEEFSHTVNVADAGAVQEVGQKLGISVGDA